jgi:predicted dehydrogenase
VTQWGIVGTGGIATQFAEAMASVEGGRIVAVASRTAARADAFADEHDIAKRYDDVLALAGDDGVDAVYVATPHSRHEADTVRLLEGGRHVLCEKPMALNATQVRRMITAAEANGRFLMEAVWSRYLPAYRTLVDLVAADRIGTPLQVDADFGFRRPFEPAHRLFNPELGGGALLDLGIYPLQLCTLVLGPIERIGAVATLGETGVDERVAAVVRHRDGGTGVVKAAITTPLACTARISGTDGWIDVPAFMHCPQSLTVTRTGGPAEVIDCPFPGTGFEFEIDEVHRCLADGLTESSTMPLADSLALAEAMDDIRAQVGVVYPGEA